MQIASSLLAFLDVFLLLALFVCVEPSRGTGNSDSLLVKLREKRDAANTILLRNYLSNYGYIRPGSIHSNNNVAGQTDLRDALRRMQEFLGVSVTGEINAETLALIRKPRCANLDTISFSKRSKRFVRVGSKWQSATITYSINNFTPKLGEERTNEAIDSAFAAWSKHIPLKFRKVSPQDNPDIVTFFAEGYHNDNTAFDGAGGYLAHAFYPGTGIGGDTHFDGAEPWTLHQKAYEGNDLFLVAVHELGHALGLGHSMNQDAIMAPVYRHHETSNFELPQDDILGIQSIYGEKNSKPIPPLRPTTTPPHTTTTKYRPPPPRRPPFGNPNIPPVPRTSPKTTTTTTTLTTKSPLPDVCKLTHFDAVSFLRRELYVFSGSYMWRRQPHDLEMLGPYKITQFWSQLKDGVNAAYEDPGTNTITFFKDHLYWEYSGIKLKRGSPRHVRFLGLQNEHVGAALWWDSNGKSFFFQDSMYWKYSNSRVERNYPKSMSIWKGVPTGVDAAFTGVDQEGRNHTYFVKGTSYWKLNNKLLRVVEGPKSFRRDWLRCGFEMEEKPNEAATTEIGTAVAVVLVCLLFAVILIVSIVLVKRRDQRAKQVKTTVISSKGPPLSRKSELIKSSNSHDYLGGKKTVCITAAQQKLRWFRFSLQNQV